MRTFLRSLWQEPSPPQPPARGPRGIPWLDVALVAALAPLAIVESVVRADEVAWRPLALLSSLVIIALIALRRSRPFGAFCAAFAVAVGADVAAAVAGSVPWEGLYVGAAILLLPYSLFRWGAGREAIIGLGIMALVYASAAATGEMKDVSEAIGGGVVMLLPAAVGASVRFRAHAQRRELETVRVLERERLARDLHDTVAHHVSAIALQAQAGRVVVGTKPDAAERALAAIEAEASRALAELRSLVGILRDAGDRDAAPLAPQPGLADVERLARDAPAGGAVVDVALTGDLTGLRPALEAALFRIAQESVTNAVRHARQATRISVHIEGERERVRVRVDDDGAAGPSSAAAGPSNGYGLAGMAERAALLGGTFSAGPRDDGAGGGWRVEAVLPRTERKA